MRLLIGPAGCGKTRRCLAALRACERGGRAALWIVPDQFTYTADRLLLDDPDLPGARFVRVVSFRRLAHEAAEGMAPAGRALTEEARRLLLRRLVQATPPAELGPLAAVRLTPGFIDALARIVHEIKATAGADATRRLRQAAADEPKLAAILRLLAAYDATLTASGLADPGDWMFAVAARLRARPALRGNPGIWIDGFMGFTPEERALVEALVRGGARPTITLCGDPHDCANALARAAEAEALGVSPLLGPILGHLRESVARPCFLPTLRTLLWLAQIPAERLEVEMVRERPPRFARSPALARLESGLFANQTRPLEDAPAAAGSPGPALADPAPAALGAARDSILLRRFPTAYHEVVGWARWIDARARLAGGPAPTAGAQIPAAPTAAGPPPLRYRDIAILVRDLTVYRPLVLEVFPLYAIPVFLDQRRDATAHPLLRLCLSALQTAARGWARDAIVALLRNPLLGFDADRIDRIENLSREYGIEYERWLETRWEVLVLPAREAARGAQAENDEEGTTEDEECEATEEDEAAAGAGGTGRAFAKAAAAREHARLAAEEARAVAARCFPALRRFCDLWRAGPPPFAEGARALHEFVAAWLDPNGAAGAARDLTRLAPGAFPAAVLAAWPEEQTRQVVQLLEQTLALGCALTGELPTSASLFIRMLKDAFRQASIGVTPQSLDAVTVAEPRRSRVDEARAIILGGLTAAAFPQAPAEDPLLSDREREGLAERGFPIFPRAAVQSEEDAYLFYIACTRARETLLLTCPAIGPDARPVEPSCYLEEIARVVPIARGEEEAPGPAEDLAACVSAGELAGALTASLRRLDATDAGALADQVRAAAAAEPAAGIPPAYDSRMCAPQIDETLARASHRAARLREPAGANLPAGLCADLFPARTLHASASRLESFGRCPFQHFARYLLRIEERPEATLSPRSTGSAVHAALERFFGAGGWPRDGAEAVTRIGDIFQALASEEAFRVFQVDPPSAYRWRIAARDLGLFIRTEFDRLRKSRFQPAAVELSFGAFGRDAEGGDRPNAVQGLRALREALARGARLGGPELPSLELPLGADDASADRPAGEQAGAICLHGRIDRLDLVEEPGGRVQAVVFDYKHRRAARTVADELARGLDLQIATYLLVIRDVLGIQPAGGLYYSVSPTPRIAGEKVKEDNPLAHRMLGFYVSAHREAFDPARAFTSERAGSAESLDEVLTQARARIRSHARRILDGEIGPAPAAAGGRLPCEVCDFRAVCRFDPGAYRPAAQAGAEWTNDGSAAPCPGEGGGR